MFIDIHCHLKDDRYDKSCDEIVKTFESNDLDFCVDSAADKESILSVVNNCNKYKNVYGVIGIHPERVNDFDEQAKQYLLRFGTHKKIIAIGEIGLDYYWNKENKEIQKDVFEQQIKIAYELKLPVVIHIRDAYEDALTILKNNQKYLKYGFLLHCYSGSVEYAKQIEKLGGYFSFGGVLTFENAKNVVKVFDSISLDRVLSETDSPYLTPSPHRGRINYPYNVKFVIEKMASIKNISIEKMCDIIRTNAYNIFKKL